MNKNQQLENKVTIVTGAASGIGAASARLFAAQGAAVCIADVNRQQGEAVAADITAAGGNAVFMHTDVSNNEQVEQMVSGTVARFGRLDILHNNAFWSKNGAATDLDEDSWDRTLAVTLKSVFLGAKHAVPAMRESGGGVIINTGSVHAVQGFTYFAAYDAAKGGLEALTKAMAIDHGPDIRVNTVNAGTILTPAWDEVSDLERQRIADLLPARRIGNAEEVAQAVLFLASDQASYITGTSLLVDGGLTCQARIDTRERL